VGQRLVRQEQLGVRLLPAGGVSTPSGIDGDEEVAEVGEPFGFHRHEGSRRRPGIEALSG